MSEAETIKSEEVEAEPPLHSAAAKLGESGLVTIEVGPERTQYHVQREFLKHYSGYFEKALSELWEKSKNLSLIDVEPPVFNLFLEWLYTQNLPENPEDWHTKSGTPDDVYLDTDLLMAKLYVFADRFLVTSLHKLLNREFVNYYRNDPYSNVYIYDVDTIAFAFNNLPSTDPILDFFVDTYVIAWVIKGYDLQTQAEEMSHLPHEFLLRYMLRQGELRLSHLIYQERMFALDERSYYIGESECDDDDGNTSSLRSESQILLKRRDPERYYI